MKKIILLLPLLLISFNSKNCFWSRKKEQPKTKTYLELAFEIESNIPRHKIDPSLLARLKVAKREAELLQDIEDVYRLEQFETDDNLEQERTINAKLLSALALQGFILYQTYRAVTDSDEA